MHHICLKVTTIYNHHQHKLTTILYTKFVIFMYRIKLSCHIPKYTCIYKRKKVPSHLSFKNLRILKLEQFFKNNFQYSLNW